MYLFYIVSEIATGIRAPLDLAMLPSGLVGYYTDFWGDWCEGRRGRGEGPAKWDTVYAPLLATLTAAQSPVSLKLLRRFRFGMEHVSSCGWLCMRRIAGGEKRGLTWATSLPASLQHQRQITIKDIDRDVKQYGRGGSARGRRRRIVDCHGKIAEQVDIGRRDGGLELGAADERRRSGAAIPAYHAVRREGRAARCQHEGRRLVDIGQ